jgi:hypothetical protein
MAHRALAFSVFGGGSRPRGVRRCPPYYTRNALLMLLTNSPLTLIPYPRNTGRFALALTLLHFLAFFRSFLKTLPAISTSDKRQVKIISLRTKLGSSFRTELRFPLPEATSHGRFSMLATDDFLTVCCAWVDTCSRGPRFFSFYRRLEKINCVSSLLLFCRHLAWISIIFNLAQLMFRTIVTWRN